MKEIKKPILIVPIASAIIAVLSIIPLSLAAGNGGVPLWLKTITIFFGSIVIVSCLSQSIIYLKQYVDYRFQELEKLNQKRESASSPNKNVSEA